MKVILRSILQTIIYNFITAHYSDNNYKISKIHDVFDSACRLAEQRGIRVTGSELVGLIPLEAILMAGRHYLEKQKRTTGVPENDIVECAVQSRGVKDVSEFVSNENLYQGK